MLLFEPVKKLSRQTTSAPELTKRSHRWLPKKPAPPVTTIRLGVMQTTRGDWFGTGQEACPTVFGNGTRFVWHGGDTQEEHVVEGALIVEVKAGLVTVHEGEVGFGGRILEGVGEAIERIGGSLGGGLIFEQSGFDGPGTAETPVRGNHLLDE